MRDHHRNLFGTDKQTPFAKKKDEKWQTSMGGAYAYKGDGSDMPTAGGGRNVTNGQANMAFYSQSQRDSGVDYRGIQKSDD